MLKKILLSLSMISVLAIAAPMACEKCDMNKTSMCDMNGTKCKYSDCKCKDCKCGDNCKCASTKKKSKKPKGCDMNKSMPMACDMNKSK